MTANGQTYDSSLLRSVLLSIQGGLSLAKVEAEHKMLIGQNIPYRAMGYSKLEDYLYSIPDVCEVIRSKTGEMMVYPVSCDETQHIAKLVARQKSNKTKRNNVRPPVRRPALYSNKKMPSPTNNGSYYNRPEQYMKKTTPTNYKPPVQSYGTTFPGVRHSYMKDTALPARRTLLPSPTVSQVSHSSQVPQFSNSAHSAQASQFSNSAHSAQASQFSNTAQLSRPTQISHPSQSSHAFQISHPAQPPKPTPQPPPPTPQPTSQPTRIPEPPQIFSNPQVSQARQVKLSYAKDKKSNLEITCNLGQEKESNSPQFSHSFEVPPRFQRRLSQEEIASPKTYKQILEEYVQRKKLGDLIFKTFPMRHEHQQVVVATVIVKGRSFGSYPVETQTREQAEEEAAKNAVNNLGLLDKGYLERKSKRKVSSDLNAVLLRIREIIDKYPNGIISTHVPKEYSEKFNEALPDCWIDLMIQSEMIKTEKCDAERTILYSFINKTENGIMNAKSETSSSSDSISVHMNKNGGAVVSKELVFPEDDMWNVFVTYVISTTDVSIRLVDYSDMYEEMANNMDMYYMEEQNCNRVANVTEGCVYAAKVDESWHRIQVITVAEKSALCTFVDHGDNDIIILDHIYHLAPEFQEVPHQAVHCQLYGLEEYSKNSDAFVYLVEKVLGKTLIAEVMNRGETISLNLFDTNTEEDININEVICEQLNENKDSMFMQESKILQAKIIEIYPDGELLVQLLGRCFDVLEEAMEEIQENCNGYTCPKALSKDKLYLASYPEDGKWYRAQILEGENTQVSVCYVDYGNVCTIQASEIRELAAFKPAFLNIPHQALRCCLHSIPPSTNLQATEQLADRLWEMASPGIKLMLKVVSTKESSLPQVELFKRLEPSNELVSINQTLALDSSLFRRKVNKDETNERHSTASPFQRSNSRSSQCENDRDSPNLENRAYALKPPDLPEVGDYLDVDVTMAISPWNFVCTPRFQGEKFDMLTEKMQKYYQREENRVQLTSRDIIRGNLYACCHKTDNMWYRVQVKGSDSAVTSVSVYFVDFGDTVIVTCAELQPLPLEFQSLSYQAIFCKLAGISPLHGDWRPEDCIRFQALVVTKHFVSLITDKCIDSGDVITLEVDLIDVSDPDADVYIGDVLLSEKRAIPST